MTYFYVACYTLFNFCLGITQFKQVILGDLDVKINNKYSIYSLVIINKNCKRVKPLKVFFTKTKV